jgi:hypothetical protein
MNFQVPMVTKTQRPKSFPQQTFCIPLALTLEERMVGLRISTYNIRRGTITISSLYATICCAVPRQL